MRTVRLHISLFRKASPPVLIQTGERRLVFSSAYNVGKAHIVLMHEKGFERFIPFPEDFFRLTIDVTDYKKFRIERETGVALSGFLMALIE